MFVPFNWQTVLRHKIMEELISNEFKQDLAAIALGIGSETWLCRNGLNDTPSA